MSRALVTGATTGLGLEFAWQLAGTGHDLVLVARDEDRLRAVAAHIADAHGVTIDVLAADLANRYQLRAVERRLTDPVAPVDLLVNATGHGLRGGFLDISIDEHEHQLDTLVRAVLVLSHAAARSMTSRRRGAIITVSALAGAATTGPLAAARTWVREFTEALAVELRGSGVTATALLPGFVHTETHAPAGMKIDGSPRVTWLKTPFVVETALNDAAAGKVLSIPSVTARTPRGKARKSQRWWQRLFPHGRWARHRDRIRLRRSRRLASARALQAPWRDENAPSTEEPRAEQEPCTTVAASSETGSTVQRDSAAPADA